MSNCGSCGGARQICTCYTSSECTVESDWYVLTNAVTGNYVSTPDAADLDITGSITLVAQVAATDWSSGIQNLVAKWSETGNQRAYRFSINSDGQLIFSHSSNGTAVTAIFSSAIVPAVDGQVKYVAVSFDAVSGTTNFYTSNQREISSWTLLATVPGSPATIFSSSAPLELGSQTLGTQNKLTGKIYYAAVYNAVSSAIVPTNLQVEFDPDDAEGKIDGTNTPSTFVSSTGETWTLHGGVTWENVDTQYCSVATGSGSSYAPYNFRPSNVPLPRPYGFLINLEGISPQIIGPSASNEPLVFTHDESPFEGNMDDLSASNNRLFVPLDGYYLVYGFAATNLLAGSGIDVVSLRRSGVETLSSHTGSIVEGGKWVMTIARLVAGDYLQLTLSTLAGVTTEIETSWTNSLSQPHLWAQWMRGL